VDPTATREKYSHPALRAQSEDTDEEWHVIDPLLPKPRRAGGDWAGCYAKSSMRSSMSCARAVP
jgi:hypothetical protein